MNTADAYIKLRALRGAPLSIVMALVIAGPEERLLINELAAHTGYHREAISAGLQALKSLGAVRNHGHYQGWSLNADWRQFVINLTACVQPVDNLVDNSNGYHKTLPEKPSMSEKPAISSAGRLTEKPTLTEKPAVFGQNTAGNTDIDGKTGSVWGDHDHVDHVVVDDLDTNNNNNIARASLSQRQGLAERLAELRPPFDNADAFITEQPATLISAWLDYVDALSPADRRKLINESAFLRRRVQQRRTPPEARPLPPVIPAEYAGLIQT